jgi:repressor LexA
MESMTRAQQELYDWLVEYIETTQHAPSIRQMMRAMNLRSPAPIQSRLERLRSKGYIDWTEGKARTLRILHQKPKGIPILGEVSGGSQVEPRPEAETTEKLDLASIIKQPNCYVLKVAEDSLINDLIAEGDMAILRSLDPEEVVPDGAIVAARVENHGTTLKHFYQEDENVVLKASNGKSENIEVPASQVEVQGILIGVWRSY